MEVTIPDTTFWKTWNTLGDLERFFMELDLSNLPEDQAREAEEILRDVRFRMENLTTQMQTLKDHENNSKEIYK